MCNVLVAAYGQRSRTTHLHEDNRHSSPKATQHSQEPKLLIVQRHSSSFSEATMPSKQTSAKHTSMLGTFLYVYSHGSNYMQLLVSVVYTPQQSRTAAAYMNYLLPRWLKVKIRYHGSFSKETGAVEKSDDHFPLVPRWIRHHHATSS